MSRRKKAAPPPLPAPGWTREIETAPGVRLCCRSYGEGDRTVLLLHGNGEDYSCFARQLTPFAERFRLLTVDSRGHGGSTTGEPMTLEAMADDLEMICKTLSLERVSVVGFSDGGNVALHFALKYPHRPERMVLAGANLFPEGMTRKELRRVKRQWRFFRLAGRVSQKARARAAMLGLMAEQPRLDPAELAGLELPVLVLAGIWDVIRQEHTELIARSIPGAHLRVIPSCGHFIFRDQPVWVNETILRFLAAVQ